MFQSILRLSSPLLQTIKDGCQDSALMNIGDKLVNITVVRCGRRDFTVSKRECQCYSPKD